MYAGGLGVTMICTRCYETNNIGGVNAPSTKTTPTGVMLALSLLFAPGVGSSLLYHYSPETGHLEIQSAVLGVLCVVELLLLLSIFVAGRATVCGLCGADALVPKNSARGTLIQREISTSRTPVP